jgi:hypothetical protein
LSVEYGIVSTDAATEQLRIASVIGYTKLGETTLQLQRADFEADRQPLDIEEIGSSEIIFCFLESLNVLNTAPPSPKEN